MRGRILGVLLIGAAATWLILSYLPPGWIPWQLTLAEQAQTFFHWLLIGSALLFVALQGWLLRSVFHFPQQVDSQPTPQADAARSTGVEAEDAPTVIRVRRSWELFWTALPLVVSIALFVISYCAMRS